MRPAERRVLGSHEAQPFEGPAVPAARVASRHCVCSTLSSVGPPQVRGSRGQRLDGLTWASTATAVAHVDGCRPPRLSRVKSRESLCRAAASPHQGVLPGAELPAACSAWFWAFPRHSETSTLGAPRGHDAGTRPGKEVQVAGLGGCCVVTGSSASWLIRASETRPAWAPPSCRAQGAQATRRHCPHSAARTAGPPAPEAAEVGVLTHTCSRAHRHSHPETHLLTHPDTHTPHATPERARRVPASLTVASPASYDNMLHGEDAILDACAVNEVTLNV